MPKLEMTVAALLLNSHDSTYRDPTMHSAIMTAASQEKACGLVTRPQERIAMRKMYGRRIQGETLYRSLVSVLKILSLNMDKE